VRELAAKVDHVQVPAYYDQIVGDLYLSPEGATSAGSVAKLEEGGGESVLPPQEQKVAALQAPQPLTSFMGLECRLDGERVVAGGRDPVRLSHR
jgi:hypothetical protein